MSSTKTKRFEVWYRIDSFLPKTFVYVDAESMDKAWEAGKEMIAELYSNGIVVEVKEKK